MSQDDLDDDDLEGVYEGEVPECDSCMMCSADEVARGDRWNFSLVDKETGESYDNWICRECHSRFESLEEFEDFRQNLMYRRLYRAAAMLNRLLLLKAPQSIIVNHVFGCIAGVLLASDDAGGSEKVRSLASDALSEASEKLRKNTNP